MSEFKGDHEEEGKSAVKEFSWMPTGCAPLADGEYDAIICGTGLVECIISGLLSVKGKRVLHVDRNNYYGADTASLGLNNLFEKFSRGAPGAHLGHPRDWNVDLIPKFIMSCGKLVKILLHSKVTRYLDFKVIDGSYVYKDGKVNKVPSTPQEALNSPLMGFFQKRNFRNFLTFLQDYDPDVPKTYFKGKRLDQVLTKDLYNEYSLDVNTQSFTGHAMALHTDDDYLEQPADKTAAAIQLYVYSMQQHGKSPYIYPVYGLGGMPEGFSRLCAIHGGTFMLNKPVDEILYKEDGRAWGIKADGEVAKADFIVGDPSYFAPTKSRSVGKVVRSICILDHPIAGTDAGTESVQIIIPAAQVGRRNDIYVCMVSNAHAVSAPNMFIAICSTTVETEDPIRELNAGLKLLGNIVERFDSVSELLVPNSDGKDDKCFISQAYDATSHFETMADDVLSLYKRITGEDLDMSISADMNQDDDC